MPMHEQIYEPEVKGSYTYIRVRKFDTSTVILCRIRCELYENRPMCITRRNVHFNFCFFFVLVFLI